MLPKIKSKAFIRLLPQIFELREQGYSYEEVTAILEKEYGLILSVNQFSVYLARYKNAHTSKVKNRSKHPLLENSIQKANKIRSNLIAIRRIMFLVHLNTKQQFKKRPKKISVSPICVLV